MRQFFTQIRCFALFVISRFSFLALHGLHPWPMLCFFHTTLIILVGFPDDVPLRFLPARGWLIDRSKPATFTVCGRRRRCPRRDVCWHLENAT